MQFFLLRVQKFKNMGHLTEMQRYTIQALRERNFTIKFIADCLERDKSVISRELRMNRDQRKI